MTAGTAGPGPPATLLPRSDLELDRRLLQVSLVVALALHCGVILWLPLPAAPAVVTTPEPVPSPPVLHKARPPLPPLPERPQRPAAASARRIPVPMIEPADVEPLDEPGPELAPAAHEALAASWDGLDSVAPPPVPEPLPENTAGLVPPVIAGPRTAPDYPEAGRRSRLEGVVVLRAVIGVDGRVTSIEVMQTPLPDLGFGDAAVRAVSSWVYSPGLYRGKPVPVYVTVYVDFDLY